MRKALLVFALVAFLATGTVFAELTGVGEPTVSGSVSTTYGYDLDSEAHGFYNDSSLTLTLPLLDGSKTKGGDDDMYGEITVDEIGWQLTDDGLYDVDEDDYYDDTVDDYLRSSSGATTGISDILDASISAKLVIKSLYVELGAPGFDMNNVDVNDDYYVDANFWVDDDPALNGIAVGFMNDMVTLEAKIANYNDGFKDDSDDDVELVDDHGTGFINDLSDGGYDNFTPNKDGYVLGAMLSLSPMDGLTIPVSFAMDLTKAETYMAIGAAPVFEMAPITIKLPVDFVKDDAASGFEVAPHIAYCLTEAGGSNVALNFVYGSYTDVTVVNTYFEDLNDNGINDGGAEETTITEPIDKAVGDLEFVFTETATKGFVEGLAAELKVGLVDIFDYKDDGSDMGWDVDAEASYDMDGLVPYVNGGYGSNEVLDLGLGVKLNAAFTGLDNTVITLDYTNEALTESADDDPTESGRVTFDVTVSF